MHVPACVSQTLFHGKSILDKYPLRRQFHKLDRHILCVLNASNRNDNYRMLSRLQVHPQLKTHLRKKRVRKTMKVGAAERLREYTH